MVDYIAYNSCHIGGWYRNYKVCIIWEQLKNNVKTSDSIEAEFLRLIVLCLECRPGFGGTQACTKANNYDGLWTSTSNLGWSCVYFCSQREAPGYARNRAISEEANGKHCTPKPSQTIATIPTWLATETGGFLLMCNQKRWTEPPASITAESENVGKKRGKIWCCINSNLWCL